MGETQNSGQVLLQGAVAEAFRRAGLPGAVSGYHLVLAEPSGRRRVKQKPTKTPASECQCCNIIYAYFGKHIAGGLCCDNCFGRSRHVQQIHQNIGVERKRAKESTKTPASESQGMASELPEHSVGRIILAALRGGMACAFLYWNGHL